MAEGDTLINSLIGAVVTAVLASAVPLAPILGGLVAGYLEGGTRDDGVRVGLYSGLIALLPLVFILVTVGTFFFGFVGMGHGTMGIPGAGFAFFLFGFLFLTAYTIGLSAVGGWLGNYVHQDTDVDI
ncbi:DUF5518 domain-containing protein [Halobacteriales archaeon Cl-PHB]